MDFESTIPLKKHEEDNNEFGTSQVVICESTAKEVKKSLSEKPFVAEVITQRADILEERVASESPDDSLSFRCQTPRESIFDPFAPGPEEVVCAPKKKEVISAVLSRRQLDFETGNYPIKSLNFGSDDAEEVDQYLLVLENMILDIIMPDGFLDRQEEIETAPIVWSPHEMCKTPDSKPLLTGIAVTCPDAPIRPSLKASKLSPSICRKIDFDSASDYHGSSVVKDNN